MLGLLYAANADALNARTAARAVRGHGAPGDHPSRARRRRGDRRASTSCSPLGRLYLARATRPRPSTRSTACSIRIPVRCRGACRWRRPTRRRRSEERDRRAGRDRRRRAARRVDAGAVSGTGRAARRKRSTTIPRASRSSRRTAGSSSAAWRRCSTPATTSAAAALAAEAQSAASRRSCAFRGFARGRCSSAAGAAGAHGARADRARRFRATPRRRLRSRTCTTMPAAMPTPRRTLRQFIEVDPANAEALNYLGYMLAESGDQLDEAVRLVQRALDVDPGNPLVSRQPRVGAFPPRRSRGGGEVPVAGGGSSCRATPWCRITSATCSPGAAAGRTRSPPGRARSKARAATSTGARLRRKSRRTLAVRTLSKS